MRNERWNETIDPILRARVRDAVSVMNDVNTTPEQKEEASRLFWEALRGMTEMDAVEAATMKEKGEG